MISPLVWVGLFLIYALNVQTMRHSMRPLFLGLLSAVMATGLAACGPASTSGDSGRTGSATVSTGTADIGGPFTLVDNTGAVVTEAAFEGQPTLLYFGFSYCPDVCPTALQKLGVAQERMGDAADRVQFVMITVDPERDTADQLAIYVTNNGFPEGLRGFTGTVEQVDAVKNAYKVYAQKVPLEDSAMDYTVDHQDIIFLLGKDGKFADFFTVRSTPADIATRTRQYLAQSS